VKRQILLTVIIAILNGQRDTRLASALLSLTTVCCCFYFLFFFFLSTPFPSFFDRLEEPWLILDGVAGGQKRYPKKSGR
jgi:cytochrome c biogenesis factor